MSSSFPKNRVVFRVEHTNNNNTLSVIFLPVFETCRFLHTRPRAHDYSYFLFRVHFSFRRDKRMRQSYFNGRHNIFITRYYSGLIAHRRMHNVKKHVIDTALHRAITRNGRKIIVNCVITS